MNTILPWIDLCRTTLDRWLATHRRRHRPSRRPVEVQLEFPWVPKR